MPRGHRPLMRMLRVVTVALLAVLGCSSSDANAPDPGADGVYRVLFIGNSLTNSNNLPATLSAVGALGGENIVARSVAFGGYSLEDHWQIGFAQEDIAQGGWDYVILQQGPSAVEENREALINMTRRFNDLIRAKGARTALYMVWPDTVNFGDFPRVGGSYLKAAEAVNGLFLPAGLGWIAAWNQNSILPLYGPDGFHPSAMGTYLTALVMYERITGKDPRLLPAIVEVNGQAIDIDVETIKLLQAAAHEANTWYQFPW